MVQGFTFTGCADAHAVVVRSLPPAAGAFGAPAAAPGTSHREAYPRSRPVVLRRVTFQSNARAALLLEEGAAAALSGCLLERNGGNEADAPYPAIWARPGSWLHVADSRFVANRQVAVLFDGDLMVAERSSFTDHTAGALRALYRQPQQEIAYSRQDGGGSLPSFSWVKLLGCEFANNSRPTNGGGGAAVSAGAGTALTLLGGRFANNTADAGGAVFLDDGAMPAGINDTLFERNTARAYGGAFWMLHNDCKGFKGRRAAGLGDCRLWITNVTLAGNTAAADGGAWAVEATTDYLMRFLRCTFLRNRALGQPPEDVAAMWYPVSCARPPWALETVNRPSHVGWDM